MSPQKLENNYKLLDGTFKRKAFIVVLESIFSVEFQNMSLVRTIFEHFVRHCPCENIQKALLVEKKNIKKIIEFFFLHF